VERLLLLPLLGCLPEVLVAQHGLVEISGGPALIDGPGAPAAAADFAALAEILARHGSQVTG
jgi:hypothetical protein